MIELTRFNAIFLHRDPCDMRKSIDGLSTLVQEEMGKDPFEAAHTFENSLLGALGFLRLV